MFGLSSITWTAIAAIAQGLAAFGSVALLVVTLLSRRDADRALEQARRLASGTAALVEVTQRAQALAVKPAIEVRRDISNRQVIIVNRGNGPLLEPRICVGNEECTFRVRDEATSEYREVGGLGVGSTAVAYFTHDLRSDVSLTIVGHTLNGERVQVQVEPSKFETASVVVASQARQNQVMPAITREE